MTSRAQLRAPLDRIAPSGALVCLDIDGTLIDIAETPDGVTVPDAARDMLDRLFEATGGATILVTGRPVAAAAGFFPNFAGSIVGGHGAERRESGQAWHHEILDSPDLNRAKKMARVAARDVPGALYEDKPTGFCLHYRRDPDQRPAIEEAARRIVTAVPALETHAAKMAVELRPSGIGKDHAVARLLEFWPDRTPIFAGDDASDEPAMALVQHHGGVAIKVGDGDSVACHREQSPAALRALLNVWLKENAQ